MARVQKRDETTGKSATTVTAVTIKFVFCPCNVFALYSPIVRPCLLMSHRNRLDAYYCLGKQMCIIPHFCNDFVLPYIGHRMYICYHGPLIKAFMETKWQSNKNTLLTISL